MKSILKNEAFADYSSFHQVRVSRHLMPVMDEEDPGPLGFISVDRSWIYNSQYSPAFREIVDWAMRIKRLASRCGEAVDCFIPHNGTARLLVVGNGENTALAASLIRKTVIEISNGDFDPEASQDFIEKTISGFAAASAKTPPKLPSCRVDFKIAVADMNKRQASSFQNMSELFSSLDVEMVHPENCPTVIELRCEDKDALKSAKLTAEWVAKTIGKEQKITRNRLIQTFEDQAIQALGRDRGSRIAQLALA